MLRRLRYAPAVVFALLALAFVGLWVRSYRYLDAVNPFYRAVELRSTRGHVGIAVWQYPWLQERTDFIWLTYNQMPTDPIEPLPRPYKGACGFAVARNGAAVGLSLPYWFLALTSLALSALLAFKPITRFTVRGLLIATTLIAAVLGAVVYAI
jgi:hypothetical protein